jgi:hypothetical protein
MSGPGTKPSKPRAPSPYSSAKCPHSFKDLCVKLEAYGKEWQTWGNDVLSEFDALKSGGTGGPPTDATQPPPPPFKK